LRRNRATTAWIEPPLATGGLLTSTSFTLYVLAIIYRWLLPDNRPAGRNSLPPG